MRRVIVCSLAAVLVPFGALAQDCEGSDALGELLGNLGRIIGEEQSPRDRLVAFAREARADIDRCDAYMDGKGPGQGALEKLLGGAIEESSYLTGANFSGGDCTVRTVEGLEINLMYLEARPDEALADVLRMREVLKETGVATQVALFEDGSRHSTLELQFPEMGRRARGQIVADGTGLDAFVKEDFEISGALRGRAGLALTVPTVGMSVRDALKKIRGMQLKPTTIDWGGRQTQVYEFGDTIFAAPADPFWEFALVWDPAAQKFRVEGLSAFRGEIVEQSVSDGRLQLRLNTDPPQTVPVTFEEGQWKIPDVEKKEHVH